MNSATFRHYIETSSICIIHNISLSDMHRLHVIALTCIIFETLTELFRFLPLSYAQVFKNILVIKIEH